MPTAMIAAIAFRAIFLGRAMEREGLTVLETWPMGVYRSLARKAGGPPVSDPLDNTARYQLLDAVTQGMDLLDPQTCSTDQFDAVAAAYAAWCSATSHAREMREPEFMDEGAIVLPAA